MQALSQSNSRQLGAVFSSTSCIASRFFSLPCSCPVAPSRCSSSPCQLLGLSSGCSKLFDVLPFMDCHELWDLCSRYRWVCFQPRLLHPPAPAARASQPSRHAREQRYMFFGVPTVQLCGAEAGGGLKPYKLIDMSLLCARVVVRGRLARDEAVDAPIEEWQDCAACPSPSRAALPTALYNDPNPLPPRTRARTQQAIRGLYHPLLGIVLR